MKLRVRFNALLTGAIVLGIPLGLAQPGHTNPDASGSVTVPVVGAPICGGATAVPCTQPNCGGATAIPCAVPVQPTCIPGAVPCQGSAPKPTCIPGAVPCPPQTTIKPIPVVRDYFFCGRGPHGIPTTYVNTATGNKPLIRWVSQYFSHSGYTPEARCVEVSQRFTRYYNQGILNYVTTGVVNNEPVVCVATEIGGPCRGILYTLKSKQDASRTIQQLFDVRAGVSGPVYESEDQSYFDLSPYTRELAK